MSTTTAEQTTTTEVWTLDIETYVQKGAFDTDTTAGWADTFRRLGGVSAMVRNPRVGVMVLVVVGTPEAHAFVAATVAGPTR